MKRFAYVLAISALGGLLGGIIASRLVRFIPICGEDCSSEALDVYLMWIGAGIFFFAGVGTLWSRTPSIQRSFRITMLSSLAVTFMLAGGSVYLYKLEQENAYLYSIREMQPTNDFSEIVIAREPIPVFSNDVSGKAQLFFTIAAWERCMLGYAGSDQPPSRVEIACRKGVGWIAKNKTTQLIYVEHELIPKKSSDALFE